jgi:alpha-tubulin suppressor-like RCC1 family protein
VHVSPRRAWTAIAALLLIACGDSVEPLDLAGPPAGIVIAQGDQQRGVIGSTLGSALAVTVTDSAGHPAPGVEVRWDATGGTVSQATDTTDQTGVASVAWTLPNNPGTYTVRAFAAGAGDVLFTAIAQPVAGDIRFRYLDAGGYHACGITTTEQLLCWGYNADGQLGLGSTSFVPSPTLVPGDQRYRRVYGGLYHACGITFASEAFCWGNNGEGRLDGKPNTAPNPNPVKVITAAVIDTTLGDTVVIGQAPLLVQQLAGGEAHTCGVDLVQRLWCWGRNSEGQLGRGDFTTSFPVTPINSQEVFKEVSVGGFHTCAITLTGDGRCWGYNLAGQLGDGTRNTSALPVQVQLPVLRTDPLVIFHSPDPAFPLPPGPFIAAGYDHSCAITVAGPTLCWGLNENGQVGDGTTVNRAAPAVVAGGHAFAAVTAGLRQTCALDVAGFAWCWGDNTYGELGDATNTSSATPVEVTGGIAFAYLKAGELFTCGVTGEGVAWCWGDNEYGQLGNGSGQSSNQPVKVAFQP